MQTVVSRISRMYMGLIAFIHIIALTTIIISATYLRDIFYTEKRIFAGVLIFLVMVFLFFVWQEIMTAKKIVIDTSGIKIYNFDSLRFILFSEIDGIRKTKHDKVTMGYIPLTEGYTYSKIILKNGNDLIISPDKFGNYLEMMAFIDDQMNQNQQISRE